MQVFFDTLAEALAASRLEAGESPILIDFRVGTLDESVWRVRLTGQGCSVTRLEANDEAAPSLIVYGSNAALLSALTDGEVTGLRYQGDPTALDRLGALVKPSLSLLQTRMRDAPIDEA